MAAKRSVTTKIPAREQKRMREAVEAAADRWDAYLETFAATLLDPEMEPARLRQQIRAAAELADLALEEYEKRWPDV